MRKMLLPLLFSPCVHSLQEDFSYVNSKAQLGYFFKNEHSFFFFFSFLNLYIFSQKNYFLTNSKKKKNYPLQYKNKKVLEIGIMSKRFFTLGSKFKKKKKRQTFSLWEQNKNQNRQAFLLWDPYLLHK